MVHRRICSPSLTETSLCGACLYKSISKQSVGIMSTGRKKNGTELCSVAYIVYRRQRRRTGVVYPGYWLDCRLGGGGGRGFIPENSKMFLPFKAFISALGCAHIRNH